MPKNNLTFVDCVVKMKKIYSCLKLVILTLESIQYAINFYSANSQNFLQDAVQNSNK